MARVFALADPHLALATPGKEMDRFGPGWDNHAEHIRRHCLELVGDDDLLLLPGDLSWAMRLDAARADLDFLGALPGTKVIIRGNHDLWWQSASKVRAALPPRMHALAGDALALGDVHLCGTRLWDVPGLRFGDLIDWLPEAEGGAPRPDPTAEDRARSEKIHRREVGRLQRALAQLDALGGEPRLRVVLVHYPPCSVDLEPNELTRMFETARIDHVVFGHIHNLRRDLDRPPFGERNGVHYHFCATDWLRHRPLRIH